MTYVYCRVFYWLYDEIFLNGDVSQAFGSCILVQIYTGNVIPVDGDGIFSWGVYVGNINIKDDDN